MTAIKFPTTLFSDIFSWLPRNGPKHVLKQKYRFWKFFPFEFFFQGHGCFFRKIWIMGHMTKMAESKVGSRSFQSRDRRLYLRRKPSSEFLGYKTTFSKVLDNSVAESEPGYLFWTGYGTGKISPVPTGTGEFLQPEPDFQFRYDNFFEFSIGYDRKSKISVINIISML